MKGVLCGSSCRECAVPDSIACLWGKRARGIARRAVFRRERLRATQQDAALASGNEGAMKGCRRYGEEERCEKGVATGGVKRATPSAFAGEIARVSRQLDGEVDVAQLHAAGEARLRFQPPCVIELIAFLVVRRRE